jgi:hypothetical protein
MSIKSTASHEFPDFDVLIAMLERISSEVRAEYDRLLQTIRYSWSDARLTTIANLGGVIDSTNLAFHFISKNLLPTNNPWWDIYKPPFPGFNDLDKSSMVNGFNTGFVKVAFIQSLFATLDSKFRIFLRELASTACNGGTGAFLSVYRELRARLNTLPADADDLIDLLRHLRNTIHNNGVHFERSGRDVHIPYRGRVYDFYHGRPVNFVNWELLIDRLDDVRELLFRVVNDPVIFGIPHGIIDPYTVR